VVAVAVMLLVNFLPQSRLLRESRLTPYVLSSVGVLVDLSPPEFRQRFDRTRRRLQALWKERKAAAALPEEEWS